MPRRYACTIETGEAHYFSRSRQALWHKGATSGLVQKVRELLVDDDQDCVWLRVDITGGASCHVGYRSCFYRQSAVGVGGPPEQRHPLPTDIHGDGEGLRPGNRLHGPAQPDQAVGEACLDADRVVRGDRWSRLQRTNRKSATANRDSAVKESVPPLSCTQLL